MPRHSKKEFSNLCGIKTKALSVYIARAKVILDDNELIDDTHPANLDFMERHKNKNGKVIKPKVVSEPDDEVAKERLVYVQDQRKKLKIDMEARQNEVELQKIKIQRQRGEMIPTDSVKQVFDLHSESIKSAYVEASDNVIVVMGQRKGFTAEDIAHVRKQFVGIVNRAVDGAIKGTQAALDALVDEFSVKRGVGQHD